MYYGVGVFKKGKYKCKDKGLLTKEFICWKEMLKRCYSKTYSNNKQCLVCEDWLDFQNFAEWYNNNYYEIDGERMALDKNIIKKGNRIYSPETCAFISQRINQLFTKCNARRGEYPIGVSYEKSQNKFRTSCSVYDINANKYKIIFIGRFNTPKMHSI